MGDIKIEKFKGMNNIREEGGETASPRVILNADADIEGRLTKRVGQTLYVSAANTHSLWACDSVMLVCVDTRLYRAYQGELVYLATMTGDKQPAYYVEGDGEVYVSNKNWCGVYNTTSLTVGAWGLSLPAAPTLSVGAGSLDAGTYNVCFTVKVGVNMSGNGPISAITLTQDQGISISNLPSGGVVWVTDPDGESFHYAGTGATVTALTSVEPLPTFLCTPVSPMECLCFAFGRIWGSVDNELIYTEPHQLGLTKNTNKIVFDQDITLIARSVSGLFVGMSDRTVFLAGDDPKKMQQSPAGSGSVKGSLAYCNNINELGDILGTNEKVYTDVPVWLSKEGIVIGNAAGRLFNLTNNRVRMTPPSTGAATFRNVAGKIQYIASFLKGETKSGNVSTDALVNSVFLEGNVSDAIESSYTEAASFGDSATCTVTRGGVLVP